MPTNTNETQAPDEILRLRGVTKATGLGRSTIYSKVKQGAFPQPIKLTDRIVGWRLSEVRAWVNSRPTGLAQEPAGPRRRRAAQAA